MSILMYRTYIIEGFARPVGDGPYAAVGRVRIGDRTVDESEDLGRYDRNGDDQSHGLSRAQQRVDELEAARQG